MSEITGRSNEPYYRREFKQEQSLYEETSNVGTLPGEGSCFSQPYHYLIFTLVALLFLGSICLLSLDLLFARRPEDEEPPHRRRGAVRTSPPRRGSSPPPPRVVINDANDDAMSDVRVTGRRHNNTPASPEHLRI
uniref:Alpha-2,8-sialyltransferase 8B n=1 Tax=Lygus hesperus TaxID=30085 RepID=A0A0A9WCE5_LYGHE